MGKDAVCVLTLALCGAVGAMCLAPPDSVASGDRCLTEPGSTKVMTRASGEGRPAIRVFTVRKGRLGFGWYACTAPGGRVVPLADLSSDPRKPTGVFTSMGQVAVTSPYVAINIVSSNSRYYAELISYNVLTRKRLLRASPGGDLGYRVRRLVVGDSGAMAWSGHADGGIFEIRRLRAGGPRAGVLLDSDPGIELNSLSLGGSTVFWTRSGLVQGAPLS